MRVPPLVAHSDGLMLRQSPMGLLSWALIVAGSLVIVYSVLFRLGVAPGSRVTLPAPVALQGGAREATLATVAPTARVVAPTPVTHPAAGLPAPLSTPVRAAENAPAPTVTPGRDLGTLESPTSQPVPLAETTTALATPVPDAAPAPAAPTPTTPPIAASAVPDQGPDPAAPPLAPANSAQTIVQADASTDALPSTLATTAVSPSANAVPGVATHVSIDSIGLETDAVAGGIVEDRSGNPVWQTLPFVAVHYADDTALVGAPGNAVLAGHVVTLYEGNVFRNLYQVNLGDDVRVSTDSGFTYTYAVVAVKLVDPSATEVMLPTAEPTLTLLTCGGTFDPRTTEFSDRLIVTARLTAAAPS